MKLLVRFSIVVIFLLSISVLKGYSQDIIHIVGTYPDLNRAKWQDVISINDEIRFSLLDDNNELIHVKSCKWHLEAYKGASFYQVLEFQESGNEFNFILNKQITDELSSFDKITFDGDSSVYNLASIKCFGVSESGTSFSSNFVILLNYLPCQPRFDVLDITYGSYDEKWDVYDNVNIAVKCRTNRCDRYLVTVFHEDKINTYRFYLVFEGGEDVKDITIGSKDYLKISAINEYGIYHSPVFFNFEEEIKQKGSPLSNIEDKKNETELRVYPNPVTDVLYIDAEMDDKIKDLSISDISGKTVFRNQTLNPNHLNVQNLPAGLYILKIKYLYNERISNIKFVKE